MEKLLDLLIPSRCAACGARGLPCCARCGEVWGSVREVFRVPTTGLVRVFALARYRGVGRRLLLAYKERGRRDLAPSLGRALAEAVVELPLGAAEPALTGFAQPAGPAFSAREPALTSLAQPTAPPPRSICLVPAPSRPSASRVRGGPHVERLANAAAEALAARGIEAAVAPALELAGSARDAVGLGRAERVANLAGRLRFREAGRPPPGQTVVVLDDVITTGATAAACTRVLAAAGVTVSAVLTLLSAG
ncbi:ComF family protein [Amycolatopsis lexingtonensis]|uniref:ComF family protein n=1 Tax=Amycolatopsis lexingtonensis TaxID=218822 RepID=UPI001CEF18B0|nr:ComF family protein [Amycolatopsis lexingtonensis]